MMLDRTDFVIPASMSRSYCSSFRKYVSVSHGRKRNGGRETETEREREREREKEKETPEHALCECGDDGYLLLRAL